MFCFINFRNSLFTVINSLGDIFYNAGMETEASVVKVVESYSEFMYGMYEKGMYLLFVFGGIIVFVYFGAYWHDYNKEQKIKRETLYYKFILEIIEKGLRDRNMEL